MIGANSRSDTPAPPNQMARADLLQAIGTAARRPRRAACVGEFPMRPMSLRFNTHLRNLDTITGGPLYRYEPVLNRPTHRQRGWGYETRERQKAELGNRMVHITFSSARGEKQTNFVGSVPQISQGRQRYRGEGSTCNLAVTCYLREVRGSRALYNPPLKWGSTAAANPYTSARWPSAHSDNVPVSFVSVEIGVRTPPDGAGMWGQGWGSNDFGTGPPGGGGGEAC